MLHLATQDIRFITQINHQRQPQISDKQVAQSCLFSVSFFFFFFEFQNSEMKVRKKKSAENAMPAGLFYNVKAELNCSPVWNCLHHLIERRFCIFELISVHTAWQHTYTYQIKVQIVNTTHTPYLHHRYWKNSQWKKCFLVLFMNISFKIHIFFTMLSEVSHNN